MTDDEKIKILGYAVITLSARLLRLEQIGKFRKMLKDMIVQIGDDVCEIKDKSDE